MQSIISKAAMGKSDVTQAISSVSSAVRETGIAAGQTLGVADMPSRMAELLRSESDCLLVVICSVENREAYLAVTLALRSRSEQQKRARPLEFLSVRVCRGTIRAWECHTDHQATRAHTLQRDAEDRWPLFIS